VAAVCEEGIIERIRIVLADLPPLAADLVERALRRQPDMVVVGRLPSPAGLLELARMTSPDAVMVGLADPELPPTCLELFAEHPALTVLGVEKQGDLAHLFQLRPHRMELGEVAPDDLVVQIRGAVGRSPLPGAWRPIRRSQR
jgi:DNA-binding NarL/FixJ family response regulator